MSLFRNRLPEVSKVNQTHQFMPSKTNQIYLVPVDFSDCSRSALIYASQLVNDIRKQLILLHVIHDDPMNPGLYQTHENLHMSRPITDIATDMLTAFITEVSTQRPELGALQDTNIHLVSGVPGSRIVEIAEHLQPDIIIMGTQCRSSISLLLNGSVASYVTRHSRVPVITIKDNIHPPVLEKPVYLGSTEEMKGPIRL